MHTHTHTRTHIHRLTDAHTPVAYQGNQGNETEEKFLKKKKGFQGRFKGADREHKRVFRPTEVT